MIPYTVAWALGIAAVVLLALVRYLVQEERDGREHARRAARRRAYARDAMLTNAYAPAPVAVAITNIEADELVLLDLERGTVKSIPWDELLNG